MASLYDDQMRELLKQPVIVRITTINKEGYPHTVPIWFMLDGDDLIVFTERTTAKAKQVMANPKGSIAIGGDPIGSPCLLIEGDYEIEDDPDHAITSRITYHYDPEHAKQWLESWKNDDFIILRLKPKRVIKVS